MAEKPLATRSIGSNPGRFMPGKPGMGSGLAIARTPFG